MALLCLGLGASPLGAQERPGSTNPEALRRYEAGRKLSEAQDWPAAAAEFQAAVQLDPKFFEAHVRLGVCRENMRQFDEAAASLEKALALRPDAHEVRLIFASVLREQGLKDRSESEARRVLEAKPDLPEAHWAVGLFLLDSRKNVEEGLQRVRRATEMRPSATVWRMTLAMALRDTGRLTEAIEEFLRVLAQEPTSPRANLETGATYLVLRRNAEARYHLLKAYADEKQRSDALHAMLMRACEGQGNYPEALYWAAQGQKASPADTGFILFIAAQFRYLCNYGGAKEAVNEALRINSKLVEAHFQLGLVQFDSGQYREAIESLRRVVDADPTWYSAWYQLGLAYRKVGMIPESDQALAAFQKLKDAEQAEKETEGIEAGPPVLRSPTTQPAAPPATRPGPG